MDAASILVLILSLGVLAMLVWFEVNSRRNDAKRKSSSSSAQDSSDVQERTKITDDNKPKAA